MNPVRVLRAALADWLISCSVATEQMALRFRRFAFHVRPPRRAAVSLHAVTMPPYTLDTSSFEKRMARRLLAKPEAYLTGAEIDSLEAALICRAWVHLGRARLHEIFQNHCWDLYAPRGREAA